MPFILHRAIPVISAMGYMRQKTGRRKEVNMKNGDKKDRGNIYRKVRYYFDLWLSKGTFSTIIFLFAVTGIFVFIIGLLANAFGGRNVSLGRSIWETMNHTFDPGVLSGDSGSYFYLFLMLIATLIGVFFLAMLIGLINDGIQSRVEELSKGIEPVVENNHVVILGFNESTLIILGELIEAYENQKNTRNAVVVMDEVPKTEMEDRIRIEFPNTGNLTVVCRSGSITNSKDLHRCSILTCKSIVIASYDDFETIKGILACTKILDKAEDSPAYITSVIYGRENEHAAKIAGNDSGDEPDLFSVKNDRLELLMMENTISKIMTHTCRQNGLSKVFTELFNYTDHEFYIARRNNGNKNLYAKMMGKSIRQINRFLSDVIAIGVIQEDGSALIGDPNSVILEEGCQLILLQEDDNPVVVGEERSARYEPPAALYQAVPSSFLIIGCNEKLPYILREMCQYLMPGTMVYLSSDPDELDQWLTDDIIEEMVNNDIDSAIRIERKDTTEGIDLKSGKRNLKMDQHKFIYSLLDECKPHFVLILAPDELGDDQADEQALKILLYCKKYKEMHPEADFGITCEMRSVANQQLAQDSMASDFVISRNIASLMMAQIAENRELLQVFETLLSSDGFEVYIKPPKYYFHAQPGQAIDFFSLQDAVAEKGEIFIGYKKKTAEEEEIILNPLKLQYGKRTEIVFEEGDELVVLAESMIIQQ